MNGASDFSLDNRLALCADFVRDGAKVADIGTDHAYLPVWLCRIGRCDTAIAADINPLPLERGIETINNSGLNNRIEARLSNGLEKISGDEACRNGRRTHFADYRKLGVFKGQVKALYSSAYDQK